VGGITLLMLRATNLAPPDFLGGRFALLADPQGTSFGLLKVAPS
jgi:hypothetical protein